MKGEDLVCPDCGSGAKIIDTAEIYNGRSYGQAWACQQFPTCDCYVGCHAGGTQPKGTLAGKLLRTARMDAHHYFDTLWRSKPRILARKHAYARLAKFMNAKAIHIGESDIYTCAAIKAWAQAQIQAHLKGEAC